MAKQDTISALLAGPNGLDCCEVENRIKNYGRNSLPVKQQSMLLFLGECLWSSSFLLVGLIINLVYEDWYSAGLLGVWTLVMVGLAVYARRSTHQVQEELRRKRMSLVTVVREGVEKRVPSDQVVLGERLKLRMGDIVPADGKITSGNLTVNECQVSSNSQIEYKYAEDSVFQMSYVIYGDAEVVVTKIGLKTLYASRFSPPGSQSACLDRLGAEFYWNLFVALSMVCWVVLYTFGMEKLQEWLACLPVFVALLVSGIGMKVQLEIGLRAGVQRLCTLAACPSDFDQVEALASVDTLLLSRNSLFDEYEPVTSFKPYNTDQLWELIAVAALPPYKSFTRSILETSLLDYLQTQLSVSPDRFEVLQETHYNARAKCATVLIKHKWNDQEVKYMKGAPEVVCAHCEDSGAKAFYTATMKEFVEHQCQAFAVGRLTEDGWKLIGLVPYKERPIKDVEATLNEARKMQLKVQLLSGVSLPELRLMVSQVNLNENRVCSAIQLAIPYNDTFLLQADGVADVQAEDRLLIVSRLQAQGRHVLQCLSDVNDLSSLSQADVTVATVDSHESIKAGASLVCTDPSAQRVVEAVASARRTYSALQEAAAYFLVCPLQILLFAIGLIFFMQPTQSHWPLCSRGVLTITIVRNVLGLFLLSTHVPQQADGRWCVRELVVRNTFLVLLSAAATFYFMGEELTSVQTEGEDKITLLRVAYAEVFTLLAINGFEQWDKALAVFAVGIAGPSVYASLAHPDMDMLGTLAVSLVVFGVQATFCLVRAQSSAVLNFTLASASRRRSSNLICPLLESGSEKDDALPSRTRRIVANL